MLKFIAHDTVNDIAIIQTNHGIYLRYGLEVSQCVDIDDALASFTSSQTHALACEGYIIEEGDYND